RQGVLHADVDREAQGGLGGPPRALHGLDAARFVEHALETGGAPVVGVDGAEHVPGECAQRVDALELGAEGKAWQPELVDALRLPWAQSARDPGETAGLLAQG